MQVINVADLNQNKKKTELLEILDELRGRVESGEIDEFVAASLDREGEVQIHACIKDLVGGVGMFEMGKNILMQQD